MKLFRPRYMILYTQNPKEFTKTSHFQMSSERLQDTRSRHKSTELKILCNKKLKLQKHHNEKYLRINLTKAQYLYFENYEKAAKEI